LGDAEREVFIKAEAVLAGLSGKLESMLEVKVPL